MRINRKQSRNVFRRHNSFNGCLSWFVSLALVAVFIFFARDQIQAWFFSWYYPSPGLASIQDVQIAFRNGDLDHSIEYAQGIYDSDNSQIDALELLVRALIYRSYADINQDADRGHALELTTAAIASYPNDFRVSGIHAFALQANDLSDDAQRLALRVIRNDENNIAARLALSLSYASQGIFEAGLRNSLHAVEIADTVHHNWRADTYRVLAIIYSDLGQYTDAADAVETAIAHNRRLLPLHFERALYAQQLGDMDTATAYYFNVIAFDDDNVKARFRLCEVSSLLGERDAAIDWCTQVTDFAPGWAEGWYRLGREYYLDGNWQQTQDALNRCSTLQVAQAIPIEDRRLECWFIQGQAAEVLADCEHLIVLYHEYQQMARTANLTQRWVYPDDTPPVCTTPTAFPGG